MLARETSSLKTRRSQSTFATLVGGSNDDITPLWIEARHGLLRVFVYQISPKGLRLANRWWYAWLVVCGVAKAVCCRSGGSSGGGSGGVMIYRLCWRCSRAKLLGLQSRKYT